MQQAAGPRMDITMDFITDLSPSKIRQRIYDLILVVVDRDTEMAQYTPVRKTIDTAELANIASTFYKVLACLKQSS